MSNQFYDEGEPARGRKVMLATTAYATPSAAYTFAIARSREALRAAGVDTAYLLLQGNCHVDDARNSVARDFLASDCTELLFLDADVNWEPGELVKLCARDADLVGGVYPYRREGGDTMPVRLMEGCRAVDGLLEVEGLPTGFMKIKRHVIDAIAARSPVYLDKIYDTALIFNRTDPDAAKTRWGGDIAFCNKWRALGGKVYADVELRLGHTATVVITDSLGAAIRRMSGTTFAHVAPRLREGIETEADYNEIMRYGNNAWAADPGVLALCVGVARKCRGPIIETGSGLSSVVMGLVSADRIYSLEHSHAWAAQTVEWCEEAGVGNVGVFFSPLVDGWYDLDKFDLPAKFSLGFCDGPPRAFGTRWRFFERIAPRCEAIIVDDFKADNLYAGKVYAWALENGREVSIMGRAALVLKAGMATARMAA